MCVVSAITDDWRKYVLPMHPWAPSDPDTQRGFTFPTVTPPSRAEFNALRVELEKLKQELLVGKAQDAANGEPDCEMEEKVTLLRQLGELMGVDFNEVFKNAG